MAIIWPLLQVTVSSVTDSFNEKTCLDHRKPVTVVRNKNDRSIASPIQSEKERTRKKQRA